jgi:signal transduction histidine kinase
MRSFAWPLHELRGALTAIQLGLSMERTRTMEALQLQLERARLALEDLDSVVDGKRRKDEWGTAELVDLRALVSRATHAWSQLAPSYGAQVRSSWRTGRPRVRGHARRIAQALDNVIANAIEHGGGQVVIESDLVGNKVRIAVVDKGEGISSPSQFREAPVRSRRGHGLAITRDAVGEHGGSLLFERRGTGSAVVIELPVIDLDTAASPRRTTKEIPVRTTAGARRAA